MSEYVNVESLRTLGGKQGGQIALVKDGRTLTRATFIRGRVVACDPSLGGCGLVTVVNDDHGLRVVRAARLTGTAREGLTGMAKDTAEALDLREKISYYLGEERSDPAIDDFLDYTMLIRTVREAPPVGGGLMRAKESSIQAGLMFDLVAADLGHAVWPLPMIYTASHRSTLCEGRMPKGLDKKTYHRDYLLPLVERLGVGGMELVTNADTRDALAVALTALAKGWA